MKFSTFIDACRTGDLTVIEQGLAESVDLVNTLFTTGLTPLMEAIKANQEAVAQRLLHVDPRLVQHQLQAQDPDGSTPLMNAAYSGDLDWVIRLLPGSDLGQVDQEGNTALIWAARANHSVVVERLLPGSDINHVEMNEGKTALLWAASAGHAQVVEVLLAHGATLNAVDHDGRTALMLAQSGAHDGHLRVTHMLIEHEREVLLAATRFPVVAPDTSSPTFRARL